ncbi:MAG TPA: threonine ammonia-lyase [Chloroflexota bacterium]|nr:threonine ammonia-lyase [Chloroflexota bacterium]
MFQSESEVAAPTLADLQAARDALRGVVHETPLLESEGLSRLTGCRVYLKAESLQRTGSFKIRGAYNRIHRLTSEERARGVIAASAGNHGQGVALAAKLHQAAATIVLPEYAPVTKVSAIQKHGAKAILHGRDLDEAYARALEIARETGATFIHPFDDWDVIAGQGTLAMDIFEQLPETGALVVPVGGGGLLAGLALATRAIHPTTALIGVQAAGASAAVASFEAGHRLALPAETIADGIKVSEPGVRPFALIQKYADQMITVEEEEIYRAVVYLIEETRLVVEPAGAVGVAALLARRVQLPPNTAVVVLLSGANVDPNLLGHLIEYGLVHTGRSLLLRITLPDRPGELVRLLAPLSALRVNIHDIEHHRAGWGLPVNVSEVLLQLETRGPEHSAEVLRSLREKGLSVESLLPGPDDAS